MDEAAKRRVRAGRFLQEGMKPVEVAAKVGAPQQTVHRWLVVLQEEGIDGLRVMSKGGRPCLMSIFSRERSNWPSCHLTHPT